MIIDYVPNWWEVGMIMAISINTVINLIVFFKHRFRCKDGKRRQNKNKR